MIPIWHPIKKMKFPAVIKSDKLGLPVQIKYLDGYKIIDESYIDDILKQSKFKQIKNVHTHSSKN